MFAATRLLLTLSHKFNIFATTYFTVYFVFILPIIEVRRRKKAYS